MPRFKTAIHSPGIALTPGQHYSINLSKSFVFSSIKVSTRLYPSSANELTKNVQIAHLFTRKTKVVLLKSSGTEFLLTLVAVIIVWRQMLLINK